MKEYNRTKVKDIIKELKMTDEIYKKNILMEDTKQELRNKLYDMINFLQKDVVGASTSSLIRTSVVLWEEPYGTGNKQMHMLTINSQGFGTIVEYQQPTSWSGGAYQSASLQYENFMKYICDKDVQTRTLKFLEVNKNKKMLKVVNDVFDKVEILNELKYISEKYQKNIMLATTQEELEVYSPTTIETADGRSRQFMGSIKIKTFVMSKRDSVIGLEGNPTQDEIDNLTGYRYHNMKTSTKYVDIKFNNIEGKMILTQIPDEMHDIFNKMSAALYGDKQRMKAVEEKYTKNSQTLNLQKKCEVKRNETMPKM